MNGLLGRELFTVDMLGQTGYSRERNGAWISGTGPIHRSISAVMAWPTLVPGNFTQIEPIIVHNPYASIPLPNDIVPLAQHVVDYQRGVHIKQVGRSMEDILGLPKDWLIWE